MNTITSNASKAQLNLMLAIVTAKRKRPVKREAPPCPFLNVIPYATTPQPWRTFKRPVPPTRPASGITLKS